MYQNKRIEFIFIRNAVIKHDHMHTNSNLKVYMHLATADLKILLHLTILTGKNCVLLNLVQKFIEIESWLSSDLFHVFAQSIKVH